MSVSREKIIQEIRSLAADKNGEPPGQIHFASKTGIEPHKWRGKYWARWGDALVEAGYEPKQWNSKLNTDDLLISIADFVLSMKKMPTKSEMELARRNGRDIPVYSVITRHFGGKNGLVNSLRSLSNTNPKYNQLATLLPNVSSEPTAAKSTSEDGWVYLLKSGKYFKIGRSKNLEKRVKQIAVTLPESLTLIHAIQTDDPSGIEAYWHNRFSEKRKNGNGSILILSI